MTSAFSSNSIAFQTSFTDADHIFSEQAPNSTTNNLVKQAAQKNLQPHRREHVPLKRKLSSIRDEGETHDRPAKRLRRSAPPEIAPEYLTPQDISQMAPSMSSVKIRLSLPKLSNPQFLSLAENLSVTQIQECHSSFSESQFNSMIPLFHEGSRQVDWAEKLKALFSSFTPEQVCQTPPLLSNDQLQILAPMWTSQIQLYTIAENSSIDSIRKVIPLFSPEQLELIFEALPLDKVLPAYDKLREAQKKEILSKTSSLTFEAFLDQKLSTIQAVVIIKMLDLSASNLKALISKTPVVQIPAILAVMSSEQLWEVLPHLSEEQKDYLIRPLLDVSSDIFPYILKVLEGGVLAVGIGNPDFSQRIMDNIAYLNQKQLSIMVPVMNSSQILKSLALSSLPTTLTTITQSCSMQQKEKIHKQLTTDCRSIELALPSLSQEFESINKNLSSSLHQFTHIQKRFNDLSPQSTENEKQSCLQAILGLKKKLMMEIKPQLLALISRAQKLKETLLNYIKALPLLQSQGLEKQLFNLEKRIHEIRSKIHPCLRKIDSGDSHPCLQHRLNEMKRKLSPHQDVSLIPISNHIAYDRDKVMSLYEGAREVLEHLSAGEALLLDRDITYEDLIGKQLTSIEKVSELGIKNLKELENYLKRSDAER